MSKSSGLRLVAYLSIYDFIVGGMSAISECEKMSRVPNVISGP